MPKFECEGETVESHTNHRRTGRTIRIERIEETIEASTFREAAAQFMEWHGLPPHSVVNTETGEDESFFECFECHDLIGDEDSVFAGDENGNQVLVCRGCAAEYATRYLQK